MDKAFPLRIYGLIGYPVKHSLSPLMHNAAFSALKINAEYKLFEVTPFDLEDLLRSATRKNIYGFNITVPYKEAVIHFLHKVSREAKLIGAVNTVKVSRGKLEGFNTDGAGFFRHLTGGLKFNPKNKRIAVVGAGGASRAVTTYLAKAKPKSIFIFDLDTPKADILVRHLKDNFKVVDFQSIHKIEKLGIADCDLLVNATPVGLKENDPPLIEPRFIHGNLLVYDLIYNPPETKLIKIAKERKVRACNGLGMLLYQGVLSFELWTHKKAPIPIMKAALEKGVRNL